MIDFLNDWICFQEYIVRNPHTVVVDPIENVMQLFDRNQQYGHVQQLCQEDKSRHLPDS